MSEPRLTPNGLWMVKEITRRAVRETIAYLNTRNRQAWGRQAGERDRAARERGEYATYYGIERSPGRPFWSSEPKATEP